MSRPIGNPHPQSAIPQSAIRNPQFTVPVVDMPDFHVIPSIEQLRQRSAVRGLEARFGAAATLDALRDAAALVRRDIARGDAELSTASAVVTRIEAAAADRLATLFRFSLVPVINATGVIVHTNLGRAPLSRAAAARVAEIAAGYASL